MEISFTPTGKVKAIYNDGVREILTEMGVQCSAPMRASHVEPNEAGRWEADMSPVGGPVLKGPEGTGWLLREEALAAEVQWLRDHRGY